MHLNQNRWLVFSLVNLFIVAVLGTIMRYKIGYSFPYLEQKHLQHAHSHFAFTGWITHTLFVLIAGLLQRDQPLINLRPYKTLITINLVCAYGMLFSFAVQGYAAISITFSTLSILVSYAYAGFYFRDHARSGMRPYARWFVAGLWFNVLSSLGTFTLAYMMASHNYNQKVYLASLYFFLHFQYNGFFIFVCTGLLIANLIDNKVRIPGHRSIFRMFWLSCIPAYFLSVLWIDMPVWLFVIVILSAIVQVIAWIRLIRVVYPVWRARLGLFKDGGFPFLFVAAAISIKLFLQLGSTIPEVSHMAFGFRHIIIAYLHLVLLAIISVFIIAYLYYKGFLSQSRLAFAGLVCFICAVYFNELILGLQGIFSLTYTVVAYANELLMIASVAILISIAMLLFAFLRKTADLEVLHKSHRRTSWGISNLTGPHKPGKKPFS
jgi:hypothetical protein